MGQMSVVSFAEAILDQADHLGLPDLEGLRDLREELVSYRGATSQQRLNQLSERITTLIREIENQQERSDFFALLVAPVNYDHLRPLPNSHNDIQGLADVLVDPNSCGYHPQHVLKVIDSQASTVDHLKHGFRMLAGLTNEVSTVLIYFAGHGIRVEADGDQQVYLCARDTVPDNVDSALSGEDLSQLLADIPARKMVMVLDACHSAGAAQIRGIDSVGAFRAGLSTRYLEKLKEGSGRAIIASSTEDQPSHEHPDHNHGLFTWHFLEGLQGKAALRPGEEFVRVLDLFHYVNIEVRAQEPEQQPVLHVANMNDNFPIAVVHSSPKMSDITDIRELIINSPDNGARALREYLGSASLADQQAKLDLIDELRIRLAQVNRYLSMFGPNEETARDEREVVVRLLRMCQEVELA